MHRWLPLLVAALFLLAPMASGTEPENEAPPTDAEARKLRTEAGGLVREGRSFEALERFDRAAVAQTPETSLDLLAWGTALQRVGRKAEASEKYATALYREPVDSQVLNNLGALLAQEAERRRDGIALLEAALSLEPDRPGYLHNLGWAYLQEGHYEEAADLLQRSLSATNPRSGIYGRYRRDLLGARTKLSRGSADPNAPNLLLVVIDSLRPDHLSAYGYERQTSPNLDALAADGVLFENAISQAPWTPASVASLLTGLHPGAHGLDGGIDDDPRVSRPGLAPFRANRVLAPGLDTLAAVLRRSGFATAGFVGSVHLNSIFGLGQGFDLYDDDHSDYSSRGARAKRRAETTNDRVFARMKQSPSEPFFLLVHYRDPHWPYHPPKPHGEEYVADYAGDLTPFRTDRLLRGVGERSGSVPEADRRYLASLYDGEIHYADAALGQLLERLRGSGLERGLLTVVTSDHGEEFFEHGSVGHGHSLYEEQIRVPLVFHWPGRLAARRVESQVQLLDVLPTVLSLLNAAKRPAHLQGRDLSPLLTGRPTSRAPLAFSAARAPGARAVRSEDGAKRIETGDGEVRGFDLAADPREQNELSPGDADSLAAALAKHDRENRALRGKVALEADEAALAAEILRRLESLGFAR